MTRGMTLISRFVLCAVLSVSLTAAVSLRAEREGVLDVDVALVLVIDTSESINDEEYRLQRTGLASAFVDKEIVEAITGGALGRIAVSVVDFSSLADVRITWTVLDSKESIVAFASTIHSLPRSTDIGRNTSISAGMSLATSLIAAAPYRPTRKIIDISGDGANNHDSMDVTLEIVRARTKDLNITVNGLVLLDGEASVEEFYRRWVLLGHGAFLIPAENSLSFGKAMRRKLVREIS